MEIELIEPTSPHSPVTKFLEKRGQGLHHLSFEVKDIEKTISKLKEKGVRVINEVPKKGAFGKKIAFLHPSSTSGVLVEVTEL
jgi:methylmalonyl-CoA epimerase